MTVCGDKSNNRFWSLRHRLLRTCALPKADRPNERKWTNLYIWGNYIHLNWWKCSFCLHGQSKNPAGSQRYFPSCGPTLWPPAVTGSSVSGSHPAGKYHYYRLFFGLVLIVFYGLFFSSLHISSPGHMTVKGDTVPYSTDDTAGYPASLSVSWRLFRSWVHLLQSFAVCLSNITGIFLSTAVLVSGTSGSLCSWSYLHSCTAGIVPFVRCCSATLPEEHRNYCWQPCCLALSALSYGYGSD